MKRLAVGVLFVSLLAGSVAMAGQGAHGPNNRRDQSDNRGGHHDNNRGDHNRRDDNRHDRSPPRQNWNNDHGRHDGNRGNDRRDWNRGNDRHDGNRGNDRRDWNRGNDRRDWNRGNDWNRNRGYNYNPRYHYAPAPRYRYSPRNDWNRPRYHYGVYHRPYGYYSHSWIRGERLPRAYYSRPYVVYDYGSWGLRSPPYGYHWVRVDSDVVLAAIATGVILDVAYNHFY
jgi:Ni/Co efflux regulator RcnB